jgi:hypothetical protein
MLNFNFSIAQAKTVVVLAVPSPARHKLHVQTVATVAIGKGLYRANDCEPSCAEGTIFEAPVDLKLEDLYTDGARYFLRTLTFSSEKPLPLSQESEGTWDLAEFYIEVPEMRSDD